MAWPTRKKKGLLESLGLNRPTDGLNPVRCSYFTPLWLPEQYLGSRSSKKRNRKLNTIPQAAKVYICTVKCQRKKHIENTFENQRPSTSPFFIIRMHFHWTQGACFVYKAGNFPLGYMLFLWLAWHAKLNIMEITMQLEGDEEGCKTILMDPIAIDEPLY